MAEYRVNEAGVAHARHLIEARQYVLRSEWGSVQPSAEDENAFLERHSWEEYAAWHLGLTEGATEAPRPGTPSSTATSAGCTAWASSPATTAPPSGATRRSSSRRTTSSSDSTPPGPGRVPGEELTRDGMVTSSRRDEHEPMPFDVHRMLRLWIDPLPGDDEAAAAAFRELYSDPVTVNGAPMRAADLVTRARAMQAALEGPRA